MTVVEKAVDEAGQRWIAGEISGEDYFAEAAARVRGEARRVARVRLERLAALRVATPGAAT